MSGVPIPYSDDQLSAIRSAIAELPALTPDDVARRDAAVAQGCCPARLWPLWPLSEVDPALWQIIGNDDRITEFSVYGLFPAAYRLVYGDGVDDLAISYDGRTRGRVAIISGRRHGEAVGVVIKPCQGPAEAEIAGIAGEVGVGPQQLPGIAGFISEEFVPGKFLTDLPISEATPERMREVGERLGTALNRLHDAGVCYNDATVSDPQGRSHVILEPSGRIRLIDFGVALLLREHPNRLTFHDAYNAARTDPMFRLFRQMTPEGDADALARFVADYGRRLARLSPEEILARDWRIADEGASIISGRFGPEAGAALLEGLATARRHNESGDGSVAI